MAAIEELAQMWQIGAPFPWQFIAIVCTAISFALSALAFMLGRAFDSDDLKKWAKSELLSAISTLTIIVMLIIIATILSNAVFTFTKEATRISAPAYFVEMERQLQGKEITQEVASFFPAQWYLTSMARCVRMLYITNACSTIITEPADWLILDTVRAGSPSSIPTLMMRGLSRTLSNTLTFILYVTYLQKDILLFAQQVALTVFLPLGIVLRSFVLTRGGGNLFIALGAGLFFIYPTAYSVVLVLASPPGQIESKCGVTSSAEINPGNGCAGAFAASTFFSAVPALTGLKGNAIDKLFGSWRSVLSGTFSFGAIVGAYASFQSFIKSFAVEVIVYAVLYPLVVMAITLTFIKSFSEFLGVEAQELIQGLIRMI